MLLQKSFYGQISNNGLLLSSSMIKPLARAAPVLVSLCQIRKAAESFTTDMVKMDTLNTFILICIQSDCSDLWKERSLQ